MNPVEWWAVTLAVLSGVWTAVEVNGWLQARVYRTRRSGRSSGLSERLVVVPGGRVARWLAAGLLLVLLLVLVFAGVAGG